MVTYNQMPGLEKWLHDSSVTLAFRNSDPILKDIDYLIASANKRADLKEIVLCDLFFSLDYWLKVYRSHPKKMEARRSPAIFALYQFVVRELCRIFHCSVNTLPRELELMFGRSLSAAGVSTDGDGSHVRYLSAAELRRYRLYFKGGKAYQFPWWEGASGGALRLAESKYAYDPKAAVKNAEMDPNFGFFVMTMGRELYMAKHEISSGSRMFHSSYNHGNTTMAAGSMLIEAGRIKAIQANSGHYQPHANNMLALLQALRMFSVPLGEITMISYDGKTRVNALSYVKDHAKWHDMLVYQGRTLDANKRAFDEKKRLGLTPTGPRPQWEHAPNSSDDAYNLTIANQNRYYQA